MYNSKLIQIFNSLGKQEKALLKKWVKSPIHNAHEDVQALFEYLLSRRKLTIQNTTKAKVFAHLYPKTNYDDLRLRHIMSLSVQVLEDFICFLMQQEDLQQQQLHLLQFYNQKNLTKYSQQTSKQIDQTFTTQKVRDQRYYQQLYAFQKENYKKALDAYTSFNIPQIQTTLDTFSINFIIETLQYACQVINAQELRNYTASQITFLPSILDIIQNNGYHNIPIIQCYFNAYMLLTQKKKERYYQQLKKYLFKHHEQFSPDNLKELYILTLNYSIQQHNSIHKQPQNSTKRPKKEDVLELYQFGLNKNIFITNNRLHRTTYKNIVIIVSAFKKVKWLQQFTDTYTALLEVRYQKPYRLFAEGVIQYLQEQYYESLALFLSIESDYTYFNLEIKHLCIRNYYALKEWDTLATFLNNFYQYLQRHSITRYHHQYYMNYIAIMRKLVNTAPYDIIGRQKLKEAVLKEDKIIDKLWLLEQLEK